MKLLNSSLQLTVVASLETTRNTTREEGGGERVHNAVFILRKLLAVETIFLLRHIAIEQKWNILDIVYFEVGIKKKASDFRSLQYGIT